MAMLPEGYEPEFDSLKGILLDLARQRTLDGVMHCITHRIVERPHIALSQVWLVQPGDVCQKCPMFRRCPDRQACLHLSASEDRLGPDAGRPRRPRIPIGVGEVGRVAARGEVVRVEMPDGSMEEAEDREFAAAESLRGFAAVPVAHRGAVLGVFTVWLRVPVYDEGVIWMRLIADHLAAAIVNARAFEQLERTLAENERLREQLRLENESLKEEISAEGRFGEMVGRSPALIRTLSQIDMVAPTDATVLILGESGAGKEIVAREIHRRSNRAQRPLIKVNCAAVPRELFESEFFGHARGSFTGAVRERAGRFEAADGGTLFLDEVGEIPLELQSKLLRVLQEGAFERVGEETTRQVNARLVAATNRDLAKEVEEGRFRQDLYYRLNVFPVEVAPLRERREDILPLAAHFLELSARRINRPKPPLTRAAISDLETYDWPGNIRELANVIERAVITWRGGPIRFDVPKPKRRAGPEPPEPTREILTEDTMRRLEKENLRRALEKTGWKVFGHDGAAAMLGVAPTTLASRIKRFGLQPGKSE